MRLDPRTGSILRGDIPLVINPLDRVALEAALLLKEQMDAQISVVSMGPPAAAKMVKECLALGADAGFLLTDPAFAGADAFATARTLAAGISKIGSFDLILCGMASSDGSTEWVGPELATLLSIPVVTRVREIALSGSQEWEATAAMEGGFRRVRVQSPVLFTATRDLHTPRTLSFSGVIKARKKEITQWGRQDLGLTECEVGLRGSPSVASKVDQIHIRKEANMISGTAEQKAAWLVEILAESGMI